MILSGGNQSPSLHTSLQPLCSCHHFRGTFATTAPSSSLASACAPHAVPASPRLTLEAHSASSSFRPRLCPRTCLAPSAPGTTPHLTHDAEEASQYVLWLWDPSAVGEGRTGDRGTLAAPPIPVIFLPRGTGGCVGPGALSSVPPSTPALLAMSGRPRLELALK